MASTLYEIDVHDITSESFNDSKRCKCISPNFNGYKLTIITIIINGILMLYFLNTGGSITILQDLVATHNGEKIIGNTTNTMEINIRKGNTTNTTRDINLEIEPNEFENSSDIGSIGTQSCLNEIFDGIFLIEIGSNIDDLAMTLFQ